MTTNYASMISILNLVAMGKKKADLILHNCSLVSVYTREIITDIQIAIIQDRIAYVGLDANHTVGKDTTSIDMQGKFICPGFADPHIHIDQFVLPSELAKKSILCGVTSLFSDPVDITSVAGYRGFHEFLRLGEDLPIRIFQTIPGGLPVDTKFSNSKMLSTLQERTALKHPSVVGMGEVFSWNKVTQGDPITMKSLSYMLNNNHIINGHTAGASGKKLNAYISSGIKSCHEPINFDQVLERLRLGMWIMIREGSIRRDLNNIIPQVLSSGIYIDRLMFCSDGLDPTDLKKYGHIDYCIRESIKLGVNPIDAITMASKNCFDYYNIRDLGGIAPGNLADIISFDSLESVYPNQVFVGGRLVASSGKLLVDIPKKPIPKWLKETVKLRKLDKTDFTIPAKTNTVNANTIFLLTEIITKFNSVELPVKDGNVCASTEKDVWKVAAFKRDNTECNAIGFLENFGAEITAIASSWSLHENDLIILGNNDTDMALAANHIIENQGGMVVINDGKVVSFLPLQFGGILSTDSFEDTLYKFQDLVSSITDSRCKFSRPHLVPLFLSFLALPSARITSSGVINIKERVIVPSYK